MKKIISILSTLSLTAAVPIAVVSCGSHKDASTNVVFLVQGSTTKAGGQIDEAYNQLVNDYNKANQDAKIKVDYQWEADEAVKNRIAAGEELPDLYVSYSDAVSALSYSSQKDKLRDMSESLKDDNYKTNLVSESYYNEGLIDGVERVLPVAKSFDLGVVNMSLLVALVKIADSDLANNLETNINEFNLGRQLELSLNSKIDTKLTDNKTFDGVSKFKNSEVKDNLLNLFNDKSLDLTDETGRSTIDFIRSIFAKNDNLITLATAYADLWSQKTGDDKNKMFSIGIDSLSNKFFTSYADEIKADGMIDTKTNNDFIYKTTSIDAKKQTINLDLNSTKGSSTINFFNQLNDIRKGYNPSPKASDLNTTWAGSFSTQSGSTYTSNFFVQGTMLLDETSSAGTSYLVAKEGTTPKDVTNYGFTKKADVLSVSEATPSANKNQMLEQGPGVTGFKSTGSNAKQKEEVVTKFLQFMTSDKEMLKLSTQSGYTPATKGALDMYKHYINGEYDNYKKQWATDELKNKYDANGEYQAIARYGMAAEGKEKYYSMNDSMLSGLISKYLEDDKSNLNLVGTVPSPIGQIIRDSIDTSIKEYVMNKPNEYNFDLVFNSDSKTKGSLANLIKNAGTGDFSEINVTVK